MKKIKHPVQEGDVVEILALRKNALRYWCKDDLIGCLGEITYAGSSYRGNGWYKMLCACFIDKKKFPITFISNVRVKIIRR